MSGHYTFDRTVLEKIWCVVIVELDCLDDILSKLYAYCNIVIPAAVPLRGYIYFRFTGSLVSPLTPPECHHSPPLECHHSSNPSVTTHPTRGSPLSPTRVSPLSQTDSPYQKCRETWSSILNYWSRPTMFRRTQHHFHCLRYDWGYHDLILRYSCPVGVRLSLSKLTRSVNRKTSVYSVCLFRRRAITQVVQNRIPIPEYPSTFKT